ncbi:hypothetical protein [Actinorugispora endophytica]|uniref:Uncharacterized protein n=1 Tax=Actinorugispora endophytica TaxID=1605990 RepID=A0A4R6UVU8_9ACTN|nr:hypothetical protein [Actinorugispora endophytica]TDQ49973.1 hypothetical protein EV190_11417 [Actinorugispora endophytica]
MKSLDDGQSPADDGPTPAPGKPSRRRRLSVALVTPAEDVTDEGFGAPELLPKDAPEAP